ncbi:MAG: glycosyltransferase [Bacteroidales bacterium]
MTTQEPIISVLIITYNQENYIAQAIESALNQNLDHPYEIVIGEDCSTDSTREICQSYVDRYPEIVRLMPKAPNKGLLNNYYDTLLACRGEFIADCAGDDYWCDPHKLQRQLEILRREPGVVMVHSNVELLYENEDSLGHKLFNSPDNVRLNWFNDRCRLINQQGEPLVFVGSSLFRRDAFNEFYNANESLFRNPKYTCEDFQLIFALLHQGDILYEDKITTVYRIINGSISHTRSLSKQLRFAIGVLNLKLDIIKMFEIPIQKADDVVRYRLREILSLSIKQGDVNEALTLLNYAINIGFELDFRLRTYSFVAKNNLALKIISSFYPKR